MCGIVGLHSPSIDSFQPYIQKSLCILANRGPDNSSFSKYLNSNLCLGHTRLAIQDLSTTSNQPFSDKTKRFSIVFNGEIYNYLELRDKLKQLGYQFYTTSDTEVLLISWIHWGRDCLQHLEGMFSFAIFDKDINTLHIVRDRFGIKPLCYFSDSEIFAFASTPPALQALCNFKFSFKANPSISQAYLLNGLYDHNCYSFYSGINYLQPGHYLSYNLSHKLLNITCWWEPNSNPHHPIPSFKEAATNVRELFLASVSQQLRADVPVSVALSGGLDSSAIVCSVKHLKPDLPIHTFSYCSSDSHQSEKPWIDIVNKFVSAIPTTVEFNPHNLCTDLEDVISGQGEPFGNTSIYAQYSVFKSVHDHDFKVILSGQGADEMLAGYHGYPQYMMQTLLDRKRYLLLSKFILGWSSWPNRSIRSAAFKLLELLSPSSTRFLRYIFTPSFSSCIINSDFLVEETDPLLNSEFHQSDYFKTRRLVGYLRFALTKLGLPQQLRDGDRDSMRWGVESRVPFLNSSLCNYILGLPDEYLLSFKGETKTIFKEALKDILPPEIYNRKDKIGFSTPHDLLVVYLINNLPNLKLHIQTCPVLNTSSCFKILKKASSGHSTFIPISWRIICYSTWYHLNCN